MRKRRIALLLTAAVLFGALTGCGKDEVKQTDLAQNPPAASQKTEPVKSPTKVRVMAAGDNLIHSSIYKQANRRAGGKGYDFAYAYRNIKDTLQKADLPVINQETVIAPIYPPSDYPCFNSPPELGDEMLALGFRVFGMSNNHLLDKGTKGLVSALDYWAGKKDALVTGAYRNDEDLNTVKKLTMHDITISFIGITEHTNGIKLPKDTDVRIIYTENEPLIKSQIERAKKESDCVVVFAHWGLEGTFNVTDAQKSLAKKMVGWGADVILGSHPHVVQKIEMLKKPDGKNAPVIYSLGNFISAQSDPYNMVSGLLDFTITKEFENNTIEVGEVKFIPTITQYEGSYQNIRIYPFSQYTEALGKKHGLNRKGFSYAYAKKTLENVIGEEYLSEMK